MTTPKRLFQIAVAVLIIIVVLEVDWKLRSPGAIRHQNNVQREFDEIRPLPGAVLMSRNSSLKTDVGLLDVLYEVQGASSTDIEKWYKQEFARLNWVPSSVGSHQSKRRFKFCRGGETAILILPEDSPGSKTEFQVEIGWGSSFKC
jgi:hypothetical protein